MKKILSSYLNLLTMSGLIFLSAHINSQDFSYSSDKFFLDSEKNSLFFEGNVTLNFEEFSFNDL